MPPIDLPPTRKSLGRKVVVFLETPPAAPPGIPTLVEVNAAMFAALHLYTPFNVQPSQNTGEGPRKLGSRTVPTQNGLATYPAVEISYSYLPQEVGTPNAVGNELYELLVPDVKRTAVVFNDLPGDTSAITADDVGSIYLVDPGVQREGETGEGEFDEFSVAQSLVIVGGEPVKKNHKFAA